VQHAVGTLQNPMTAQQLEDKLADCAAGRLDDAECERLRALVLAFDTQPDVTTLAALLRGVRPRAEQRGHP
jgi:hypothetical protein